MELKVTCACGQRFKFDVEPVNRQMPFAVNCPSCGADETATANTMLAQMLPDAPPPVAVAVAPAPVAVAAPGRLQINRAAHAPAPAAPPPVPTAFAPQAIRAPVGAGAAAKDEPKFNMILGIVGAIIGAGVGVGLMFAFVLFAGFAFPLMGIAIGLLTGWGARLMARGTDFALGVICGGIALVAILGTLFLLFGAFMITSIISVVVCVSVAYQIAS